MDVGIPGLLIGPRGRRRLDSDRSEFVCLEQPGLEPHIAHLDFFLVGADCFLGGIELWRRWRYRNSPASRAYNALLPQQRWAIGTFYVVLVAVTIIGAHATYIARSL